MSLAARSRCWVGVALLAACGPSEEEPPADICSAPFEACGGDVLGRWQVYTLCANEPAIAGLFEGALPPECVGSFRSAETFPADLRLAFTNMGSFVIEGAQQLHLEYSLDEPCATAIAPDFGEPTAESCALLEGEAPEGGMPSLEEGIVDCALVDSACACDSVTNGSVSGSASFVVNGTDLIIGDEPVPYCVSGDTLTYVDEFGLVSAQRQNY